VTSHLAPAGVGTWAVKMTPGAAQAVSSSALARPVGATRRTRRLPASARSGALTATVSPPLGTLPKTS
jgi:hypothetical protein